MFPPPIDSLAVCTANPRQPVAGPPFTGIASNIPSLLMFIADMTPGTACRYNKTNPGGIICTAQQIAPYMLLTAEHCVNGAALRGVAGCSNSELVDLVGEWCRQCAAEQLCLQPCCCNTSTCMCGHVHLPTTVSAHCLV